MGAIARSQSTPDAKPRVSGGAPQGSCALTRVLRKFRLLYPTPYILHEAGALRARRDGCAGGSKNADRTIPLVSETKPRKRECDGT